ALAAGGAARLRAQLFGACIEQHDRLGQRDGVGRLVAGDGGVDAVVADIRAVAAVLDHHRAALVGMFAERLPRVGAETAALAGIGFLLGDQGDRAIEAYGQDVFAGIEIGVGLAVLDVGPEAADAGDDRLAVLRVDADFARQREQRQRLFQVDVVGRNAFRQAGALGLLDLLFLLALLRLRRLDLLAELQIGAETAAAQRDLETGLRVLAQHLGRDRARSARAHLPREVAFRIVRAADEGAEASGFQRQLPRAALRALAPRRAIGARREDVRLEQVVERVEHDAVAHLLDLVDRADELIPEFGEHRAPIDLAVRDLVEFLLEVGGEVVFDVAREEAFQEGDDDAAFVLGDQALLVDAHIAAVLQHLQDRGVGRGPADAELFHALDQRRFREARRRLGEMLRGIDRLLGERLALRHRGQAARLVVFAGFVLAFLVERKKAVELDHLAGGAQLDPARSGFGEDVHRGALELGGFHLAGDREIPDQLVEPGLIAVDIFGDLGRGAAGAGRAHGFVRFLRVLRLVVVFARRRRHVFLAVIARQHGADVADRFRRHVDAVGAHIGDETGGLAVDLDTFVQPLRQPHGDRRRETELAARFLLHGGGGEGRRRIAPRGLGLDRRDGEAGVLQIAREGLGFRARADVEALDLLAVGADQARFEGFVARRGERRADRPVFLGDEF